jgi:hypothetical protein
MKTVKAIDQEKLNFAIEKVMQAILASGKDLSLVLSTMKRANEKLAVSGPHAVKAA